MERHRTLKRQLMRCKLSEQDYPPSIEQWQQFLDRVNRAYIDLDQERYLSERSQKISSKEMEDMYNDLQEAERIARLGSWSYYLKTKKMYFSPEAFRIFGLDFAHSLSLKQFFKRIYPTDRGEFAKLIKTAINNLACFDLDIRINANSELRWLHVHGNVLIDTNHNIQKFHGTVLDITEQKNAQEREKKLVQELLVTARHVGMADVAVSVLHNIGNVLNSVNVSINILKQQLIQSKLIEGFSEVNKNIKSHADNFSDYLQNDPHGKLIPYYLELLEKALKSSQEISAKELEGLTKNAQHIKDVVSMQQTFSGILEVKESISLSQQIREALNLIQFDSSYTISCDYQYHEPLVIDKVKLIQILINIIRNAKDSLIQSGKKDKKLTIKTTKQNDTILILISDNGVGIDPKNLTRIFSFGFTTKPEGHGIGLHTSALLASEMGGSLKAQSKGYKKGATFILELPAYTKTE